MNNFLNSALNRAGNIAYNYLGGREFSAAQKRNAKLQQERGFLGSLKDAEYWKQIGMGTLAASTPIGVGGLVKGGVGLAARALGRGTARTAAPAGVRMPPAVARPQTGATFDDIQRASSQYQRNLAKQPYQSLDNTAEYAARSRYMEQAAARAASRNQQKLATQTPPAPVRPVRQPAGPGRIIASAASTAGTGAAAATYAPKTTPKPPKILQAATNSKNKNKGVR